MNIKLFLAQLRQRSVCQVCMKVRYLSYALIGLVSGSISWILVSAFAVGMWLFYHSTNIRTKDTKQMELETYIVFLVSALIGSIAPEAIRLALIALVAGNITYLMVRKWQN